MAEDTLDPTHDLVTLFGRLPEVKVTEHPLAADVRSAGLKRRCNRCREIKERDGFYVELRWKPGLKSICKACVCKRERDRRRKLFADDPGAKRRISLQFKQKNYGIAPERFEAMFREQGGKCAICRTEIAEIGYRTHLDHCHKTGRVRGILCHNCNHAVGGIEKSGASADAIVSYIMRHHSGRISPAPGRVIGARCRPKLK